MQGSARLTIDRFLRNIMSENCLCKMASHEGRGHPGWGAQIEAKPQC